MNISDKNIDAAVDRALAEPTLADALVFLAIWENDRAVKQAIKNHESGERAPNGALWETYFALCFKRLLRKYPDKKQEKPIEEKNWFCPRCGRDRRKPFDGDGIMIPCCNPACGGNWGTGCYCCHHPKFDPDLDVSFQEETSKPEPELIAVAALMFAARRIQNTLWYGVCRLLEPDQAQEGESTLETALKAAEDAKTLLEVV